VEFLYNVRKISLSFIKSFPYCAAPTLAPMPFPLNSLPIAHHARIRSNETKLNITNSFVFNPTKFPWINFVPLWNGVIDKIFGIGRIPVSSPNSMTNLVPPMECIQTKCHKGTARLNPTKLLHRCQVTHNTHWSKKKTKTKENYPFEMHVNKTQIL